MKPLRFAVCATFCGLLSVVSALPVHAQSKSAPSADAGVVINVERPFRLKLGGFFPTNSVTKRQVGKNFLSFGGTWDFYQAPGPVPVFYSAYLDWANRTNTTGIKVGTTNVQYPTERGYLGVGVALRNYLLPTNGQYNPYVGAGVGIYQFRSKLPSMEGNDIVSKGKTNTRFGGKFYSGIEMPQGYFGEIDYTLPGDSTGNGISMQVGYRF